MAFAAIAAALCGCRPQDGGLLANGPWMGVDVSFRGQRGVPLRVSARFGDRYVVRLGQFDVDAALILRGPSGKIIDASAAPGGSHGREYLFWEAKSDGTYTIEVASVKEVPKAARARMEIFRIASDLPEPEVLAMQRMQFASRQLLTADAATLAGLWDAAAASWSEIGERGLLAECLLQLATLRYYNLQNWDSARDAALRALNLFETLHDEKSIADASLLIGMIELERERTSGATAAAGDNAPSLLALRRARELYLKLGLPVGAAEALNNVGIKRFYAGDAEQALADFTAAADEYLRAGATEARRSILGNIAVMYLDRGDYRGAVLAHERQLASLPLTPSHDRASVLQNGATACMLIGETERALDWYLQSIAMARALKDPDLEARARLGLGIAHLQLLQPALALPHLRAAVQLWQRPGERDNLGSALTQLGNAERMLGDADGASRRHEEALAQLGTAAAPAQQMRALIGLGMDQAAGGRHEAAIKTFTRALQLPALPVYAMVSDGLLERARSQLAIGATAAALRDLDAAIAHAERNEIPDVHAIALIERARLQRAAGRDDAALADSDRALQIAAPLRAATTNPDNRVLLAQRLRGAYDIRISVLAERALAANQQGDLRRGAELAGQAVSAVGQANQRDGWLRHGSVGPRLPRDALFEALAGRRYRLAMLTERSTPEPARIQRLEAEIALLRSQVIEASRQSVAPDAAGFVDIADSQRALATDAALLVYWMSTPHSWLWVVTRDSLRLVKLPRVADIENANSALLSQILAVQRADDAADRLARMLLPLTANELSARTWLIVADGPAGSVPWPLLQWRRGQGGIVQLPSLAAVTRQPIITARATAPRLLLIGDPIFNADDARLRTIPIRRSDAEVLSRLPRLPGTARELARIAALDSRGSVQIWTGGAATRSALLGARLADIDVLHLATHASLDPLMPELAAVMLSRYSADGLAIAAALHASDVLRLTATPAVVVLSACDAAAEPSAQAAGMMNLTRAFLARGSRQVIASLWPAADASTAELMAEFYRHLLSDRESPEVALARAQATLAASPRWQAPFFWAGFAVLGAQP